MFKEEIPLNHFVELPEELTELNYSNMLCGVIRGALEMVRLRARGAAIAPLSCAATKGRHIARSSAATVLLAAPMWHHWCLHCSWSQNEEERRENRQGGPIPTRRQYKRVLEYLARYGIR